ncbi:MAG: UDP-2,4-diacetamido-2,4,6-trideoxy-beta-L-altropyranose hydrolase [Pseudomonadota bacterium]
MPDRARILFRCDAGAALGGGHVMRCLTLADELARQGAEIDFLVNDEALMVVPALDRSVYKVRTVESLGGTGQAEAMAADIIVFDHYGLGAEDHRAARPNARHIVVIDDLADRAYDCDLLIDHNHAKTEADYAGRTPPGARVLAGAQFALIQPGFAATRSASLERRAGARLNRVLISFGLTDVGGVSRQAYHAVRAALPDCQVEIVVAARAPSRAELEACARTDPLVRLHAEAQDMAALMSRADLALGGAGGSALERCVMGLPSLTITVADNQLALAAALHEAGAAMSLGPAPADAARITRALHNLKAAPAMLRLMSERAATICDGRGAERAARAILSLFDQVMT